MHSKTVRNGLLSPKRDPVCNLESLPTQNKYDL